MKGLVAHRWLALFGLLHAWDERADGALPWRTGS
jgi:hypothetical protein